MLERQISMGLKISLIIAVIILVHGVSTFAGHLGLISDLFILLGLIQSIKFLTNKDIREEMIESFKDFINIKDIKSFINKVITFVNEEDVINPELEDKNEDEEIINKEDTKCLKTFYIPL